VIGDRILAFLERRAQRMAKQTYPGFKSPWEINWIQGPGGEAARRISVMSGERSSPVAPPCSLVPLPKRRTVLPKMATPVKTYGAETETVTKIRTY